MVGWIRFKKGRFLLHKRRQFYQRKTDLMDTVLSCVFIGSLVVGKCGTGYLKYRINRRIEQIANKKIIHSDAVLFQNYVKENVYQLQDYSVKYDKLVYYIDLTTEVQFNIKFDESSERESRTWYVLRNGNDLYVSGGGDPQRLITTFVRQQESYNRIITLDYILTFLLAATLITVAIITGLLFSFLLFGLMIWNRC